jgi:ubiquitin-protein ligase E3 B
VCEGILLDVQFASFLLAKLLGRNVFLEELKELDEDVWKNLIYVKNYEGIIFTCTNLFYSFVSLSLGDVEVLGLTFEVDEDVFGKIESHELKYVNRKLQVEFYVNVILMFHVERQTCACCE